MLFSDFLDHEEASSYSFYVDFEMKNAVLQKIVGVVFNEAMQRVLSAFENQAMALYAD